MVQRQQSLIDDAINAVIDELEFATKKYGAYHSMHEGLGVIYEEFDELCDEIRANSPEKAIMEAKQVAATAIAFMVDIEAQLLAKNGAEQ